MSKDSTSRQHKERVNRLTKRTLVGVFILVAAATAVDYVRDHDFNPLDKLKEKFTTQTP
jgi:hypothetical protein